MKSTGSIESAQEALKDRNKRGNREEREKTREKVLEQGGVRYRRWCRGTVEQEAVQCCVPREAEAFLGQDQATVSLQSVPVPVPVVVPVPLLEDPVPILMKRSHKVEKYRGKRRSRGKDD